MREECLVRGDEHVREIEQERQFVVVQLNDPSANTGIAVGVVKYVTNVASYDRRIQSAINIQGRKMQRRAEFLLTRALRRTGWT